MNKKTLFWAPRIIIILFAVFLSLFSFDVFENTTILNAIIAFLIHNIPSFILILLLIISWKHDLIGSVIFTILGIICAIGTIIALFISPMFNPILIIGSIVFLSIGILFLKQKK